MSNHLFATLETLKDAKPTSLEMEIKKATAVRLVAGTIIEAAKLEVSFRKITRNLPQSTFFDVPEALALPANSPKQLGK